MERPTVPNRMRDPKTGVTYVVMAYRQLERWEVLSAIRSYASQQGRKPKRGSTVEILTSFGAND